MHRYHKHLVQIFHLQKVKNSLRKTQRSRMDCSSLPSDNSFTVLWHFYYISDCLLTLKLLEFWFFSTGRLKDSQFRTNKGAWSVKIQSNSIQTLWSSPWSWCHINLLINFIWNWWELTDSQQLFSFDCRTTRSIFKNL